MEKVLVGMSGGVDSSVSALLLKNKGLDVAGITLWLCEEENVRDKDDAKRVCKALGIEHHSLDLRQEFSQFVITDFIEQYKNGNTPNPCLVCNKYIKFGEMIDFALKHSFDKIATGHYARVEKCGERYILKKAADSTKDQSYVLYALTQEKLACLELPLGELTKSQIREIAEKEALVCANRPDSQDICFVPDGDYASFIEKIDPTAIKKGNYIDGSGNILGKHQGIIHYTLGQRKGLGIALGKPRFVIGKSAEDNTIILGDEEQLFKRKVIVKDVNFIPFDTLTHEMRVTAKLRYRQTEQSAMLKPLEDGRVELLFDEPQRAPSAGQAAVFYDGEIVVGGGIIC